MKGKKICIRCGVFLEGEVCGSCGERHYFQGLLSGGFKFLTHHHDHEPTIPHGAFVLGRIERPFGNHLVLAGKH